jgi:DNA-binding transcriptional LysR family regulator
MDLKRFRNFAVVAATGSFRGAAAQLYIAQPALSRQMRSLEEELGVLLFERSARGVRPTAAGEMLLSELERLIPQFDLAIHRTVRAAKGQTGILRVAFTQVAAEQRFTAAAFAEARRVMRETDIRLSFIASDYQLEKIEAGEIDVGLLYVKPPVPSHLAYRDLQIGKFQLVVPKNHSFAQRGSVKLADLDDREIIFGPKSLRPMTHSELMAAFVRAGVRPRIVLEPDNERVSLNMVAEGIGMVFLNTSLYERHKYEGVVCVSVEDLDVPLHLVVAWRRDKETPAIVRFVDLLVTYNERGKSDRAKLKPRKKSPAKR